MKKVSFYIIIGLVLAAIVVLLFLSNNEPERQFDPRVTLRKKDKLPYGTFIAFENLKHLFPLASIKVNKKEPAYWDSLSVEDSGQALIIISPQFFANEHEMRRMINFAEHGNDVFISAMIIDDDVKELLKCNVSYLDLPSIYYGTQGKGDSLVVSLSKPPFRHSFNYSYPGQRLDSRFITIDASITTTLGSSVDGQPNFIHFKTGKGNVFLHLAPLAFSNFFLLKRKNISYYENALSVISPNVKTVVWDEYYLGKRSGYGDDQEKKSNWFNSFMRHRGLREALLTAMGLLLLFVLFEMRRKQRYIPMMSKPRNDSMDFVKTIGRLYFEKGDHHNLARKMGAYFLEHVRNKYKLPTGNLDEEFIKKLQFKSGVPEPELREIVTFIQTINHNAIGNRQLADFYKKLEAFYLKA
ncbi:MAG TPA: hypothetical protein VFZ42_01105 [Chitinophagaceae bacterium]